MKPLARGKSIFLREVILEDAEFILSLRTNPLKNKHVSITHNDLERQKNFIISYTKNITDYYFIICDLNQRELGTVRIYDIKGDSFCWGSWILSSEAPANAAIESALLLYDFAFYSLHYARSHFDVRKENSRVVSFHKRFGANIVKEDGLNLYFEYTYEAYLAIRQKYSRYLP